MTTNNPAVTAAAATQSVPVATIVYPHSFTFKNYKQGTKGYEKLEEMLSEGLLTSDDILVIPPKDLTDSAGNKLTDAQIAAETNYRRVTKVVELSVPLVSSFVTEGTLTPAQIDHVQALVNKAIAYKHQEAVAERCDYTVQGWQSILEENPAARIAQVKVTADMLSAAVDALTLFMDAQNIGIKGQQLTQSLAHKKFNAATVQRVPVQTLEKVQIILANWFTSMDALSQNEHQPVMKVWSDALERALQPEDSLDADIF